MLEEGRRNNCGMDAKLNPQKTVRKKGNWTNGCGLLSTASTSKMCEKQSVVESMRVDDLLRPFSTV